MIGPFIGAPFLSVKENNLILKVGAILLFRKIFQIRHFGAQLFSNLNGTDDGSQYQKLQIKASSMNSGNTAPHPVRFLRISFSNDHRVDGRGLLSGPDESRRRQESQQ